MHPSAGRTESTPVISAKSVHIPSGRVTRVGRLDRAQPQLGRPAPAGLDRRGGDQTGEGQRLLAANPPLAARDVDQAEPDRAVR